MNKIILLLLCWSLVVFAEVPSWFPENVGEIRTKCKEEAQLTTDIEEHVKNHELKDSPEIRAAVLCIAKGLNVYSEDTGLQADRVVYSIYTGSKKDTRLPLVQNCINEHKDETPKDAMVLKVLKCIIKEEEKIREESKNTHEDHKDD